MDAASLVDLGERYAALGLSAAARSAFSRALGLSDAGDATPARRLAEMALAAGDGEAARRFASEAVRRDPGPASRVLLGRAQLAAGEVAAARLSLASAVESAGAGALLRARARLGQSMAAQQAGDDAGAAATVMAALDDFLEHAAGEHATTDLDGDLALCEELVHRAVTAGRVADVEARGAELRGTERGAPLAALLSALTLAALQGRGGGVADDDVEDALRAALAARPSAGLRMRLIERQLRRRHHDREARVEALTALEALAEELAAAPVSVSGNVALARVQLLLAAAFEEDPGTARRAEEAYRAGLALRPGHAEAASRLALLTATRGDEEAALTAVERALAIDPDHHQSWRSAARLIDASSPGAALPGDIARVLGAAAPGIGGTISEVAAHLVTATAEVARGDVIAGMHARGHRLKNVLGIIGARARSARKLATDEPLAGRLADLEGEVTALYHEWAGYLRSMQTTGPVLEVASATALLSEVIAAAQVRTGVPVRLHAASAGPDLHCDPVLLREALLNVVFNACEACEPGGGAVDVHVRAPASGGTPVCQIEIVDSGPGMSRADLARVFVPGFTTKETGSGVGLPVAERIVGVHQGRILIDSEEGRGTRVTITLPVDLGGFAALAPLMGAQEVR